MNAHIARMSTIFLNEVKLRSAGRGCRAWLAWEVRSRSPSGTAKKGYTAVARHMRQYGKELTANRTIVLVTRMNVAAGPAGAGLTPTYSNAPQYGFAFLEVRLNRDFPKIKSS